MGRGRSSDVICPFGLGGAGVMVRVPESTLERRPVKFRSALAVLVSAVTFAAISSPPSEAGEVVTQRAKRATVVVTVPESLVEGDRFVVKVKVGRINGAN